MSLPTAILAGGLATRLRPATETIPKALIEVAGRPFVEHQLAWLRDQGVDRVVFCVAYRGEMIQERRRRRVSVGAVNRLCVRRRAAARHRGCPQASAAGARPGVLCPLRRFVLELRSAGDRACIYRGAASRG